MQQYICVSGRLQYCLMGDILCQRVKAGYRRSPLVSRRRYSWRSAVLIATEK